MTSVFVLGQRFDFSTFDQADDRFRRRVRWTKLVTPVTQQTIADRRATLGMFGSGFIEMLARQMTADLQAIRDGTAPGQSESARSLRGSRLAQ